MTRPLSICAVATGGSSGRTFAQIETVLRQSHPDLRMTIADTLPLYLRQPGTTVYPGRGTVVSIDQQSTGVPTRSTSQSVNLLLNGGVRAWMRMIAHARSVLTACQAQAVLFCNDRIYIETAFIEAARSLGIPTVMVQEGPMCIIQYGEANSLKMKLKYLLAPAAKAVGAVPPMPDYGCAGHDRVLAVSENYKRRWIEAGVSPQTIRVVGVARFDSIAARIDTRPPPPGKRRIMFVVQPFAAQGKIDAGVARDVIRMMAHGLNMANRAAPIDLVIRAHPRSGGDDVAAMREILDFPVTTEAPTSPIEEELPKFDCVVGHYSTALLEAVLLRVPTLIVPVPLSAFAEPGEGAKQAWIETIGLPVARTPEALAAALADIFDGKPPKVDLQRLQDETGVVDGQSTHRIAAEIMSLADGTPARAPAPLSA